MRTGAGRAPTVTGIRLRRGSAPCRCRGRSAARCRAGRRWRRRRRRSCVPFTITRCTPIESANSRAVPPGRSSTSLHLAGVDGLGIEHERGRRGSPRAPSPRSRSPNSSAGTCVISCTQRSIETSLRPRSAVGRGTTVGYGAPHMRSRCAPASEPPIITSGWSHASARIFHDFGSLSEGSGHSTVRRSSLITMSSSVSNAVLPRSLREVGDDLALRALRWRRSTCRRSW